MRDPVGVGARDPHAKHAAERMRHDIGLGNVEMIEQRDRIARERIEMQIALRLRRFAEADLVRHHHAIAGFVQRLDDRRPIARWEISAVQQHHGASVRLRGRHVHIRHPHLFAVVHERQQVDGVGIGKALEPDAIGLTRGRFGCLRDRKAAHNNAKRNHDRAAHRRLHLKDGALLMR